MKRVYVGWLVSGIDDKRESMETSIKWIRDKHSLSDQEFLIALVTIRGTTVAYPVPIEACKLLVGLVISKWEDIEITKILMNV